MDVNEVENGDAPSSDSSGGGADTANPLRLIQHGPDAIGRFDSNDCVDSYTDKGMIAARGFRSLPDSNKIKDSGNVGSIEKSASACVVGLESVSMEIRMQTDTVHRKTEINWNSDAKDVDAPSPSSFVMESKLPDESWMTLPDHERKMWERLRSKPLRQETKMLKTLKLPVSTLNRLVRLHPELQEKSSEAMDIINYATVLMLQAVAHAILRGRRDAHSIRFEDLRQACLNTRELQFLLPINSALDSSALVPQTHLSDARGLARQSIGVAANVVFSCEVGLAEKDASIRTMENRDTFVPMDAVLQEGDEGTDCESAGELTPVKARSKRKRSDSENKKHSKARRLGFTQDPIG